MTKIVANGRAAADQATIAIGTTSLKISVNNGKAAKNEIIPV